MREWQHRSCCTKQRDSAQPNEPLQFHPEPHGAGAAPAGGAHASAHARRIHWPGADPWPGKPLRTQIERDDTGSIIFWGLPASVRRHSRRSSRSITQGRVHRVLRRARRHQGDQGRDGRRRKGAAVRHAHHRVHRRDPSLQQGAAGCVPSTRGEGKHPPDRRDHGEPVIRDHLRTALTQSGLHA